MQWPALRSTLVTIVVLVMLVTPASSDGPGGGEGDRTMEVIGAVLNTGSSSAQYGYISSISDITGIFAESPANESTALLTFYSDTTTLRVINHGPLRIVNREGTMAVYFRDTPGADFANPESFRGGTPVMVSTLRHQVILDTTTNQFTTIFLNTVTSGAGFAVGGRHHDLGKPGQTFRGDELRHILKGRDNYRHGRRKRTIQYSGEQSRILPRHGVRDAPQEPAIGLAEDETRGGA